VVHPIDNILGEGVPHDGSLAGILSRRHGSFGGVVAHLGVNGWRILPVARLLSAPILTLFHWADADAGLRSDEEGEHYARLRRSPAAFFLGVSKNLVEQLPEFGTPPERTLLHLGIDLERYPLSVRGGEGRRRIVMAGRFRPQKGHALAIQAFAEFVRRFPDWSLEIFGSGREGPEQDLEHRIQALTREMGLDGSVRFHSSVPAEVLQAEFALADIMLHTSIHARENNRIEDLPNVVLEAMATGLPVVGTRQAGLPEAVLHERTGVLAEEGDVAGLATALGRLASDPALRCRFGIDGRRHVELEFDAIRQGRRLAEHVSAMGEVYTAMDPLEREQAWRDSAVIMTRIGNREAC
jgi:glycosyltransferase involved in cell wall biosynthesis